MNLPPKNTSQAGMPQAPAGTTGQQPVNAPHAANRPAGMQQRPMQPNPNMRVGAPMQGQGRPMQPNPNMRPMQRAVPPQATAYSNQPQAAAQQVHQQQATPHSAEMQQASPKPTVQRSRYEPNFASDFNLPPSVIKTKGFLIITICALFIGIIFGSMMGGSSKPTQQVAGLRGVVSNHDVGKTRIPRCGITERGQACLLYIMNSTRYDKIAEDFFDEAVKLMGIQQYSIAMVNPKYAKERIPPGYFAEIKIPNVR